MRRFAVGDIHGGYQALKDVLFASEFDYEKDQLFCLGDVADGWPEVPQCFEELLKINNLVYIIGNHDEWLLDWFKTGATPSYWTGQGGQATINAYNNYTEIDTQAWKRHRELLSYSKYYHVTEDKKLFVHGGFDWHFKIEDNSSTTLCWDRHLWSTAQMWEQWNKDKRQLHVIKDYDEVFIGHTTTSWEHADLKPVNASNVWNLDQGGGWEGVLTLMDIDTKEYWQSELVKILYPNAKRR